MAVTNKPMNYSALITEVYFWCLCSGGDLSHSDSRTHTPCDSAVLLKQAFQEVTASFGQLPITPAKSEKHERKRKTTTKIV